MTGRSTGGPAASSEQPALDQSAPDRSAPDRARPGAPSRRQLLTGARAFGAEAVAGGLGGCFARPAEASPAGAGEAAGENGQTIPFYGPHQAGIATPAQDRLAFGSLNVVAGASRADLRDLLREWTAAAARMARGRLIGEVTSRYAPPVDTGEAAGSPVSRLTITLGYGPSLFDHRFGLAGKKPAALAQLPPLPNENLDPDYTGGDLCIQACSDDPLVAFHAVRNLARLGMGVVGHDWMELGFGRTSTTTTSQATPRNLLGFKDGTRNIKAEQTRLMDSYVWAGPETDQPWLRSGSYLVARKIRIFVENWDQHNGGTRILRRGYSFADGIDPQTGTLLGGLFFIAFMKNPAQFIKLQNALAADALNEYIHHTGSAVFACPPGIRPGQRWGDGLFT